jgi:hypothetical protein
MSGPQHTSWQPGGNFFRPAERFCRQRRYFLAREQEQRALSLARRIPMFATLFAYLAVYLVLDRFLTHAYALAAALGAFSLVHLQSMAGF